MITQFKVFYGTERNRVPIGTVTLDDNKPSFRRVSGHVSAYPSFWHQIAGEARRLAKSIGHTGTWVYSFDENSLVTVERI